MQPVAVRRLDVKPPGAPHVVALGAAVDEAADVLAGALDERVDDLDGVENAREDCDVVAGQRTDHGKAFLFEVPEQLVQQTVARRRLRP